MAKDIQAMIKEHDIEFVDFRFTDPRGKCQHTTYCADQVDDALLEDGVMFDGSSISGWKTINESDMILMPDLDTVFVDPFTAQPTLVVFCDVLEPSTGQPYGRDPRSTARRALAYLNYTGIGDTAFFGPELEFFLFDDVRFNVGATESFYSVDAEENAANMGKDYDWGNMGHRPRTKGGYFPVAPVDSSADIRSEMLTTLRKVGIAPVLHHHEVAPAQNELGIMFSDLISTADNVQKYKYVIQMVAHSYGKSATFMPKPIAGDNGSGMHVHQSIFKGGQNMFAGDGYGGLSDLALYYIGGIFKHARALNAFTNASTNSYKRLVPGFEAPVLLAYSARNRSASCRIPYVSNPKGRRIEIRFPDSTANPYLAFAAMLMAGLDGIQNKIHPGEAADEDLYDLPPAEQAKIPTVAPGLDYALAALDADREFLKAGGVFTDEAIDGYLELKRTEVDALRMSTHPIEFQMSYSC